MTNPYFAVLFLADILLDWSVYKKEMTGTVTARSIITEDPTINDAQELRKYARTAPIQAVAILDHLANNIPDRKYVSLFLFREYLM